MTKITKYLGIGMATLLMVFGVHSAYATTYTTSTIESSFQDIISSLVDEFVGIILSLWNTTIVKIIVLSFMVAVVFWLYRWIRGASQGR